MNPRLPRLAILASIATSIWSVPAGISAELGGRLATVATDQGRMAARLRSVAAGRYTRHELTRPNGGMVREFTNDEGAVFAVTWSGPGKPDLRALLGRYFPMVQGGGGTGGAGGGRAMHSLRRPAQVNAPDLQLQTGGHMGWFHGVAFIRSLAPAGFSTNDLPQQP